MAESDQDHSTLHDLHHRRMGESDQDHSPRGVHHHLLTAESDQDRSTLRDLHHRRMAESDQDHSPRSVHHHLPMAEWDQDRSTKLRGLSYWVRKLSQHLPRPGSATPSLRTRQATPKRLQRATLT